MDASTITAIWGAVTGSIGTAVSLYLAWIYKRDKTPSIRFARAQLRVPTYEPHGLAIRFVVSLQNSRGVPVTVLDFAIDLGSKVTPTITAWLKEPPKDGQIRLVHGVTMHVEGTDWQYTARHERDQPIVVGSYSYVGQVHLRLTFSWKPEEDVDHSRYDNLVGMISEGKFELIANLSNGTRIKLHGKDIELMPAGENAKESGA